MFRQRNEGSKVMKNPMTHIKGTSPTNDKVIKQHKFVASGYTIETGPNKTNTFQTNAGSTGKTKVPGLTK
jgi:hypothetical protein